MVCSGNSHFKNSGHLQHRLRGISLPHISRTAAFPKGLLQTYQQIRAVGISAVHSEPSPLSSFSVYLSVVAGMSVFASANPVCVIRGPIKAHTEGQRCEGLYQVKSSVDRAFFNYSALSRETSCQTMKHP